MSEFFGIKGKTFQRQYKNNLSEYHSWGQKSHAKDWIIYPENLSESLSLDEVALSDGELYTVLTSKRAKGRKGSIVAIIKGTQSDFVIAHLLKISRRLRMKVNEISLDIAGSMKRIAKTCFPCAAQVIDRFHVQKLALEALQEIRIKHRWEAIEMENNALAKAYGDQILKTEVFENGDSRKQLLARSRYLLYKSREKWTLSQRQRASVLFTHYPDLEKAYWLTDSLRKIYNQHITKSVAMTKLAHWFKNVEEADFTSFSTLRKTIMQHYRDILNYFDKRSTNAAAESFNAKIKNFRMQLRGVKDRTFFLFRLTKLFA
ncbi:ISAon1 family transposase [Chryseobacterium sp. JK1]|uniref:ISAon1 family transposase n=1 Tax=Chryseobacterium sp. JK1 TaxID=874294 RepID=UPI003D691324